MSQELSRFPLGLPQEVFTELQEKYGEIEEMNVCDNLRSPRGQCLFQGDCFPPIRSQRWRHFKIEWPPLKPHSLKSITKSSPAPELLIPCRFLNLITKTDRLSLQFCVEEDA